MTDCDLTGQIYKGKFASPQGYDGRTITVLGWCPLSNGYESRQRVLVRDSTGRMWATDAGPVRAEIARQQTEREEIESC